jgi:DNA end-binding protein Ku
VPDRDDDFDDDAAVARAFWSGTITFGLVSIPVSLYAASRPQGVSLRMIGPRGRPLARRYFSQREDRELDADEIVRGYEVEKGRYVIVDDDELERLAPERTRDIDVRQFVEVSEIDPIYFERGYYLAPGRGSNKAYRLLARAMEDTGRAGIATFVLRAKEYLVAIIAENGILRAETLRFADEIRSPADVGLPAPSKPKPAEVKRVDREIEARAAKKLSPKELEDHARDRLLKLAERKLRSGEDVVQLDEDESGDTSDGPPVIDLMEILKRRMAGLQDDGAAGGDEADGDADEAAAARRPASHGRRARRSSTDDLSGATREELYERAKELDIPGRSKMSRDQLAAAIRRVA